MPRYSPPEAVDLGSLSELTQDVIVNHKIGASSDLISVTLDNPPLSAGVDVPITGTPVVQHS